MKVWIRHIVLLLVTGKNGKDKVHPFLFIS